MSNTNRELTICAAIMSAIDIMAMERSEQHAEANAKWLKSQVTDAFTQDWTSASLSQWLQNLCTDETTDAPPWTH